MTNLPLYRQLATLRKSKGVSQAEVAQEFGRSSMWVSNIETGKKPLSPELYAQITDYLSKWADAPKRAKRQPSPLKRTLRDSRGVLLFEGTTQYIRDNINNTGTVFVAEVTDRFFYSEDHARRSCGKGLIAKYYELSTERGAHGAPTFRFGTSTYREVRRTVL